MIFLFFLFSFFFFLFSFFLVPTLHHRLILPCFYIMPRSPPTKIRRPNPRPYPILPGSPLNTAPNAPKKNASSELPWTEQLKLIRKFDVWKEEVKRLGQKKPSVRLFEDTYAKRNQVWRYLRKRTELENLEKLLPSEAGTSRRRVVYRPFLPVEYILKDWIMYFRARHIPINITVACLLAQDVYKAWSTNEGPLQDNQKRAPSFTQKMGTEFHH